ncbi:MAG TPA: glycogen debranching protein GlgX [Candidatus Methylacidiphilales bacterium]
MSNERVEPGLPYPLGATWTGRGVQFALFSENAAKVELCFFDGDGDGGRETRVPLLARTDHVWHGFFPDRRPGQRYGYRVDGPWDPDHGHRFNPAKLLLDPYAKATDGALRWDAALNDYAPSANPDDPGFEKDGTPMERDGRDSAPFVPKGVVIDDAFDWENVPRPNRPMRESLVYELHVRGFTKLRGDLPEGERGTYRALGSDPVIGYLKQLGVTAVELLPVHQFADERYLAERHLTNYWGYNTLAFLAPHAAYGADPDSQGRVREFKEAVKRLHRAGIEVILDVVYNHTAEGGRLGPALSLRGLDNRSYYRLRIEEDGRRRHYVDFTGCGNTLDATHPFGLRLVLDSLRYWHTVMGVDGFRFDLAPVLCRDGAGDEFNLRSAFLDAVRQDPALAGAKLIAEPWDLGHGGYRVGGFPSRWSEWNGKYRDALRTYWKSHNVPFDEVANRFAGSPDLYRTGEPAGRPAEASVNFVTAHDGFTLRDLVSYDGKHNEANGNENKDGEDHNASWNGGAEGETDDDGILARRRRRQRSLLASLLLSQGVPMLLGGDERNRTQEGNNNAYCQDGPLTWQKWEPDGEAEALAAFVARTIALRRELGMADGGEPWTPLDTDEDGHYGGGLYLERAQGAWLLYVHNGQAAGRYRLPEGEWEEVLDTAVEGGFPKKPKRLKASAKTGVIEVEGLSLRLLKKV